MNRLGLHLGRLAVFAHDHWRPILAIVVVLLASLPVLFRALELDTDSSRLVPSDDPLAVVSRENRELFGEPNPLLMLLEFSDVDPGAREEFVSRLVATVVAWEDVTAAGENPAELRRGGSHLLLRSGLLRSDDETFDDFVARFEDLGMRRQLLRSRRDLVVLDDPELRREIASDLLGLREYLTDSVIAGSQDAAAPVFGESERRVVVILPQGSAEDGDYSRALLGRLDAEVNRLAAEIDRAGTVRHGYAGVHAITADSIGILGQDLVRITLGAAVLLVLLLLLALRDPRAVLCCLLPLGASLAGVTLLATLLFQPLNILTIGFAAVVLGLGLDFALHTTVRYLRFAGVRDRRTALRETYEDCGPPVVVGAVSTALAFLALLLVGHPGLRQFGLLVSTGLLVTLIVTLLAIPAIVRLLWPAAGLPDRSSAGLRGSSRWMRWGAVWPGRSLTLSVLAILSTLWMARSFELEMDIFRLASEHLPSVRAARELEDRGLPGSISLMRIRLAGSDPSRVADAQTLLDQKLEELRAEGVIVEFDTSTPYLPRVQNAAMATERLARAEPVVGAARDVFFRLVDDLGFRSGPELVEYFRTVETAVDPSSTVSDPWVAASELDARVARLMAPGRHGLTLLTTVWPSAGLDGGRTAERQEEKITREVQSAIRVQDGVELAVSGTALLYQRVNELMRDGFPRALGVGLVAVAALILFFLRRVSWTIAALVPLAAALVATAGLATGMGVAVTPSTLPFAAVVIGIGIDDAVHLLARASRAESRSLAEAVEEIGPVITLTTLSSAIGFGALAMSRLSVIAELGTVVALGILACWFFSLFLLPGLVLILERRRAGVAAMVLVAALAAASARGATEGADLGPKIVSGEKAHAVEILERIAERLQAEQAVSCEFEQVKTIEQLEGEIRLAGKMLFAPPRSFRIEVRGDESYLLLSDGTSVWLVDRELETTEELSLADALSERWLSRLLPPLLGETPEEVLERFQVVYSGRRQNVDLLTLTPEPHSAGSHAEIRLEIDQRARVRRSRILFANGDCTDTTFRGWKRLSTVPSGRFRPPTDASGRKRR